MTQHHLTINLHKVLPELDEQGQSDAKVWAELVAEYGMEGAKALADDLAAM